MSVLDLVRERVQLKKEWTPGKDWVQYSGPYFTEEEYVAAIETMLSGWLILAEDGLRFERKFCRLLGKQNGVLTNSGSSANLLMMSALTSKRLYNLPKGTKVVTPVAGFPTTINPILQVGFEPVFIDVENETLNLNIEQLEEACKKNDVRVITFAHALGNPPNMTEVMKIVDKYNLILLEDCCDALGSTYDGKPLGSFGEFASCSFYPAHHITLGEGGYVAAKTEEQKRVVRSLREWGRGCYCSGKKANLLKNGTCNKRFCPWLPSMPDMITDHKYVYEEIGYNLKPMELQASIGLKQLKKLDEIKTLRKRNYSLLFDIFKKYEEFFILPLPTENSDPSWFAFPLTIKDGAPFNRNEICGYFEDNKIQTRPYFAGNVLLHPAYSSLPHAENVFNKYPISVKITKDTFFLGTSPVISEQQIEYIGNVLENFMRNF